MDHTRNHHILLYSQRTFWHHPCTALLYTEKQINTLCWTWHNTVSFKEITIGNHIQKSAYLFTRPISTKPSKLAPNLIMVTSIAHQANLIPRSPFTLFVCLTIHTSNTSKGYNKPSRLRSHAPYRKSIKVAAF